jgi:hypothetical protein
MANQTSNENKSCPDCGRRIAIYKGHTVACQCTYAERDTEYKTLDEIEAVVLRVKLQLLRGYTYPSEGQWRDDLEDLASALRSAVGMVREMEKSEAWLGEMNRKMERERDEARQAAMDSFTRESTAHAAGWLAASRYYQGESDTDEDEAWNAYRAQTRGGDCG